MATRGRFKGWKSAKAIAAMNPAERAEYDALVARVKAEREAEKIAKGIDPNTQEKLKAKREEKIINLQNLINTQLEYQNTHIMSQEEDETESNGKPWYQETESGTDHKETNINHLSGEGFCIIESNEDFWIRKIAEMIEKTPDKVIVLSSWSNNDMIRVKIPYSCMKKIKTQSRTITEEQRQRMSELGKSRRGRPRKNKVEEIVKEEKVEMAEKVQENTPANTEVFTQKEIVQENTTQENTLQENTNTPITQEEETDEEFENTPMNRFRPVEEDEEEHEDYTDEEEESETEEDGEEDFTEEDGFTFCNSEPYYDNSHDEDFFLEPLMSFGSDICNCRKDVYEDGYGD